MSIRRFIRNYELIITTPNRVTTIVKPPLKIAFQCLKSTGQGLNKLNINIWNLKKSNRLKIVKDKEENVNITIELKIGYKDIELETIFKGNVFYSSNVKEGASYISKLECLDGMFDYIEGVTVISNNGIIIFPVVEPFGTHLQSKFNSACSSTEVNGYAFPQLTTLQKLSHTSFSHS